MTTESCPTCGLTETDTRALWAVRVLDRWAEQNPDDCMPARFQDQAGNEYWECPGPRLLHTGKTPDAARIAAAEALVAASPDTYRDLSLAEHAARMRMRNQL